MLSQHEDTVKGWKEWLPQYSCIVNLRLLMWERIALQTMQERLYFEVKAVSKTISQEIGVEVTYKSLGSKKEIRNRSQKGPFGIPWWSPDQPWESCHIHMNAPWESRSNHMNILRESRRVQVTALNHVTIKRLASGSHRKITCHCWIVFHSLLYCYSTSLRKIQINTEKTIVWGKRRWPRQPPNLPPI